MNGPAWFIVEIAPGRFGWTRLSRSHLFGTDRPDLRAGPAACGYNPEGIVTRSPIRYVAVSPDETVCRPCRRRDVDGWPR